MARKVSDTVTVDRAPPPLDGPPQEVSVVEGEATVETRASGRYERTRVLGRGGMGTVVLVHDATVGRNVALKELNEDRGESAVAVARFAREARVQGQLEHPAIVPVDRVPNARIDKPFDPENVRDVVRRFLG